MRLFTAKQTIVSRWWYASLISSPAVGMRSTAIGVPVC